MNITEILTQAQQSSDAVTDLLIELAQQNKEVSATAQHMCNLYFADVRLREKGIRDKVATLEKQMTELDAQICGMQVAVVDAAGTGDADTFAQVQDKLAKIEARKAAVSTQINMLKAAHVRGSDNLYQAACDAYSDLAKANSAYEKALDEINLVAKKQAEVWNELEDKSESSTWSASTGHISYKRGKVRDFEKVREHYNAQPETLQPKSKESSPVINLEIDSFRSGEYPAKGRFTSTPGGNGPA